MHGDRLTLYDISLATAISISIVYAGGSVPAFSNSLTPVSIDCLLEDTNVVSLGSSYSTVGVTAALTVTAHVADLPPAVAVTVQLPAATASTTPPSTVANPAGDTDQVMLLSVALLGLTSALSTAVLPTCNASAL